MNVAEVILDLSRPTTHSARYHTRQECLKRSWLWQEQHECLLGRIAVTAKEPAFDSNSPSLSWPRSTKVLVDRAIEDIRVREHRGISGSPALEAEHRIEETASRRKYFKDDGSTTGAHNLAAGGSVRPRTANDSARFRTYLAMRIPSFSS